MYKTFTNSVGALTLSALVAATALSSCRQSGSENQIVQVYQQLPLWKPEDLEVNKDKGPAAVYNVELNRKPEFYHGRMPLKYKSMQSMSGMAMGIDLSTIFAFEFDDFSNFFIYDAMTLTGIVTIDNSNNMVAQARITYVPVQNDFAKVVMEEFHYSGGSVSYHCMSQVDIREGTKISESSKSGKKSREYFFILPIGLNEH
jgi:hypothetical protein